MHLTRYSDYSLRVLIFLGNKGDARSTIPEIARAYGISRGHLMKVVHLLGQLGYVKSQQGRGGGLLLGMPPEDIRVGQVLRHTEGGFELVECLAPGDPEKVCRIASACKLRGLFADALGAFLSTLDKYTLADLIEGHAVPLRRLLRIAG